MNSPDSLNALRDVVKAQPLYPSADQYIAALDLLHWELWKERRIAEAHQLGLPEPDLATLILAHTAYHEEAVK